MATFAADSIWFNATSTGTGSFVVASAVSGAYQTPAAAGVPNGSVLHYSARTTTEFENGEGVYNSGTVTLTRVTIFESSNAGSIVNFASVPTVAISPLAEDNIFPPTSSTDNAIVVWDGTSADAVKDSGITLTPGSGSLGPPVPVASGGTGQITEAEAIGEMTQALAQDDIAPDDFIPFYDTSADTGKKVIVSDITLTQLFGSRTYFVRANLGTCTISGSTITLTSHGLSVDDQVVFSLPADKGICTMTIATPAVVTKTSHGFTTNDPIKFSSTGAVKAISSITIASPAVVTTSAVHNYTTNDQIIFATDGSLPTGITAGTTYFIIATGLTTTQFQFSTSLGGAAVNTSGSHTGPSFVRRLSGLPTGVTAGTRYFVIATGLTANDFQFSTTSGGAAVNTTLTQDGTHYVERDSFMPTGNELVAGTKYFVVSVPTGNTMTVSATQGGGAITTTGTTAGKITLATGNDANDGLTANRTGALFSITEAITAKVTEIECRGHNVTVQIADGLYLENNLQIGIQPSGVNDYFFTGNTSVPANVLISAASAALYVSGCSVWISGLKLTTSNGHCLYVDGFSTIFFNGSMEWGSATANHMEVAFGGTVYMISSTYIVSGGSTGHWVCGAACQIRGADQTVHITGTPSITQWARITAPGYIVCNASTFVGPMIGQRYAITTNGAIQTFGSGATYLPGTTVGSTSTGGQYA